MTDTERTVPELQALLANNTSKSISPQKLRDLLVSLQTRRKVPFRVGTTLYDPLGNPLKILGVNRYNIAQKGQTFRTVEDWFASLSVLGLNGIRFWWFQEQAELTNADPVYYEPYLARFRAIIALCKRYGLYAVPVLGNQWGDTDGNYGTKGANWYGNSVGDYRSVYGNYKFTFIEWITTICKEFKDEPTILMWQFMNEAECANTTDFQEFADRCALAARAADPNHMISLGTMGGGQNGMSIYSALHANYDVGDYHDYNFPSTANPANMITRFSQMAALSKPLIVGEAGINATSTGDAEYLAGGTSARATAISNKLDFYWAQANAAAWFIWSAMDTGGYADVSAGFEFDYDDPLATVLSAKATALGLLHP